MKEKNYVIRTKNLTKDYTVKGHSSYHAVDHVDLAVPEGAVYGFLGPNGAGKSTTMKMLLGLIKPTGGDITVLGTAFAADGRKTVDEKERLAILRQTGSLIETPSYYGHLTGRENLQILCLLKNVPESEIQEVLSLVRMEKQQDKKAGQYSLGMKQRLGLAGALLGNPKLLLLDEPTNGLDPAGIQEMRELIRTLPRNRHITVMVSSHLLSEIDQMVDYVGVINKGQLIYQDSLLRLHEHSKKELCLRTTNNNRALCLLQENQIACKVEQDILRFPETEDKQTAFLMSALVREGIGILRLWEQQKSLEDIFLSLTGKQVSL